MADSTATLPGEPRGAPRLRSNWSMMEAAAYTYACSCSPMPPAWKDAKICNRGVPDARPLARRTSALAASIFWQSAKVMTVARA